jgi:ATP adenylyltransferase
MDRESTPHASLMSAGPARKRQTAREVDLEVQPLWTPWRMTYILGIKSHDGCVFCDEVLDREPGADLVIHRGRTAFVVLNLYPYTTAHLMVVPYRHVSSLDGLTPEEIRESTALLRKAETAVEAEYGIRRHHVGLNLGRCAGAGVEGHLHIHLVPRGQDEVTASPSREMEACGPPEPLIVTRDRLRGAWNRLAGLPGQQNDTAQRSAS